MKTNRREFLKGLASLASLFCLGAKNPDKNPIQDPQETLDNFNPTLTIKHETALNTDFIDSTAGEACESLDSLPLRPLWLPDSPYAYRPKEENCSNCYRYFCGPACKLWWKRDYLELTANHASRQFMPFEEDCEYQVGTEAYQTAKDHWNKKYLEHVEQAWTGSVTAIEIPDPDHRGQFIKVAEVKSNIVPPSICGNPNPTIECWGCRGGKCNPCTKCLEDCTICTKTQNDFPVRYLPEKCKGCEYHKDCMAGCPVCQQDNPCYDDCNSCPEQERWERIMDAITEIIQDMESKRDV